MAPKRSTTRAGAAEEALRRVRGEGYPRLRDRRGYITLASLRNDLATLQQEQIQARQRLPELIRQYTRMLRAKDQQALDTWLNGPGRETTREHRKEQHDRLVDAQTLLEDFLYFQNHTHRRNRLVVLHPNHLRTRSVVGSQPAQYRFLGDMDPPHRRQMIDRFDAHGIGGPLHRNGLIDWEGNVIQEGESDLQPRPARLNELHLWTPVCRRRPVGFGVTEDTPMEREDLMLDGEAAAEEMGRIEDSQLREEDLPYQTHAERRQQELRKYQVDGDASDSEQELPRTPRAARPKTASVHVEETPHGSTTIDRFREIQTAEGVFIAASESSYDWHTSYDSLGLAKSSIYRNFPISDEREMIVEPGEEPAEVDESANDPNGEASSAQNQKSTTSEEAAPESNQSKRTKAKQKLSTKTKKSQKKTADTSNQKEISLTIDYPYPANEFKVTGPESKSRLLTEIDDPNSALVSTEWCEETYGRHEWHDHMLLSPASPVNTPPQTPIGQLGDLEGDGSRETDDPNLIPRKRVSTDELYE